ncbi:MAG: cobalt ECF transporter T component CbiQ [Polyangiaceae bacterium]|nr:cobalt ECF transporter T component CbiQ [Polyangiaceae bacterium]
MTSIDRTFSLIRSLDDLARRDTPLARIDARAKVLATFALLVTLASFGRYDVVRPLPLLILLAAGVALGDVPVRVMAARVAIASPFAIMVGIWNPLFEPEPMLRLGPLVLSAGWLSFLSILERFLFAMAGVLVLIATTGMDAVATALGRLGMPRVLVTQLLMLYRYTFVLVAEVGRMLRAHALRAPDHPRPTWRTMRSLLGELLLRSLARAERVHAAMLCRGFDGEIRRPVREHFGILDAAMLTGSLAFCVVVRLVDVPRWMGHVMS